MLGASVRNMFQKPRPAPTVRQARQLERFLTQPFFSTEGDGTGNPGRFVPLEETHRTAARAFWKGEFADRDEGDLYMIAFLGISTKRWRPPMRPLEVINADGGLRGPGPSGASWPRGRNGCFGPASGLTSISSAKLVPGILV